MLKIKPGKIMRRLTALLLILFLAMSLAGCGQNEQSGQNSQNANLPTQGEYYYDLSNVVLYLDAYGELPPNYLTKAQARELGWQGGSVEQFKAGAAIGGDRFGNREELLPTAKGRSYTECDLNTQGADSRGAERLVFSNDGLYYYTGDHYASYRQVIVEEGEVLLATDDCTGEA